MEKIEIAQDNWTFQTIKSKEKFVPFGVNYTPGNWASGFRWVPDIFADNIWNENRIEKDISTMTELGANVLKVAFSYARILPDPQSPGNVKLNRNVLKRFDRMLKIAEKYNLRIIIAIAAWWNPAPKWYCDNPKEKEQPFLDDDNVHKILHEYWKEFAKIYSDDGRIFHYSFAVEMNEHIPWKTPRMLARWVGWLKGKYHSIAGLNKAWNTNHKTWEEITIPGYDGRNAVKWWDFPENTDENENNTNDQRLFDYLLFREYLAFRLIYSMYTGVKSSDSKALTGMGFIQFNPILRTIWGPSFEGPLIGLEFNAKEIVRALDIATIHFYPRLPGEDGTDQTRADFPDQLKYLESWARYAYIGKPVILEEYGDDLKNHEWCKYMLNNSKDFLSGWLSWTYRNTKNSDSITKICGLLDEDGNITDWGKSFKEISDKIKSMKLKRKPAPVMELDKKWLYTSSKYRDVLFGLIKKKKYQPVDFEMPSNESNDDLIKKKEHN